MTIVKRLRLVTAGLTAAAVTAAVGSAVFGDLRSARPSPTPVRVAGPAPADPFATTRFTDKPAVTYQTPAGELLFAWQVKPALTAAPRPRDVLVLIDTSASQAGAPLAQAQAALAGLTAAAGADDRFDVWTVNIDHPSATRSLTGGFHPAGSTPVKEALVKLADAEFGSGAVDLKAGLEKAAREFAGRSGRAAVMLYLGDGESAASKEPFTEAARVAVGQALADKEIAFYAVPLGAAVHPHNLHGLATLTGGVVVRATADLGTPTGQADLAGKLTAAFNAPILRPDRVAFGPEGMEVYPTRLPPLRADRPTLVVGKLKGPAQTLSARVEGRANGVPVTVDLSERVPGPEAANFFLASVLKQWKDAPAKDAPAVLPADRTLAMAAEQFRMFRDEFTLQGVWALSAERLDHAQKLFEAALKVDPQAADAVAGLRVLNKLRTGEAKTEQVKARIAAGATLERVAQDPAQPAAAGGQPAPAVAPPAPSLLDQQRAAQQVAEQEFRVLVDDTLRRARRLFQTDPDGAYEDLKRQRDAVLNNDQLSEIVRRRLVQDLEAQMREVQLKGAQIKRDISAQRERIAQARQRLADLDRETTLEEQTRARIDVFKQLMSQGRFELAQQEAQAMIQERFNRGLRLPPEAYAAYRISQAAGNIREQRELRRIREDRYLLTMLQADKSFIPYPDEPPVHFPPASVWRELTAGRVARYGYGSMGVGEDIPESFRRLRTLLEGETDRRVNIRDLANMNLGSLLDQLQTQFADYGVRFVFRTDLFSQDIAGTLRDTRLRTSSDLSGLPLGSFLDVVLRDIEMSWIARPDYIEIGPNNATTSLRYDEKVTRAFDVAELIVGIPNAQSTQALLQNLAFLGAQATIFGAALNPFNGLNPFGFAGGGVGIGGFGGGLGGGGFPGGGVAGAGLGALGALGAGGGIGGAGLGAGGQQFGGAAGQAGFGGGVGGLGQLGAGGGFAGNPLGNLTGQFGIQGNDQSRFLLTEIFYNVAYREWEIPPGVQAKPDYQPKVEPDKINSMGLYPPSRALIIRATHRYHPTPTFDLRRAGGMAGAGGPGLKRDGQFAGKPAGGGADQADARAAAAAMAKRTDVDPAKVWNQAFGTTVTKPELVADAADILFELKEFKHAAEAIKAGLRHGRVTGGWAQDALAVALQADGAAGPEVERVALSGVDLEPADPKAYLKAAKAERDLGRYDVALAYCQRAAALEPNSPAAYVEALGVTDRAKDVTADVAQWALAELLNRDWPTDGADYHVVAKDRAARLATKYTAAGNRDAAARLQAVVNAGASKTRDLVIELLWQGQADLDLAVTEPSGAVCSATHRRTTGGGVLKADILEQQDDNRSEVYTAASGFSGTYLVAVKVGLGKAVGNTARVKVTRFQGTPKESVELVSVDLTRPTPITVALDGGSRTDLATVPVEVSEARLETTLAPMDQSGPSGGTSARAASRPALSVAQPTIETKVPGIAAGQPGLRIEQKLSADRKKLEMSANPVFTGPAKDIPLPKLGLLPGGAN
ncbi:MAG: hypothetical protein U0871_18260 [Gemmataceae bacterium]